MKRIWAPWRSDYVVLPKPVGCVFCEKAALSDDLGSRILFRGKENFVIMNTFPYNPGHLMVVPFRHLARIEDLTEDESNECFRLVRKSVGVLEMATHPNGFNVGMNLGKVAGAGIADHMHVHIVPRWSGDTNFMPVIAETKVVSESMDAVYNPLKPYFE
ncbi:MAG: HIT domain-containing protein [Dehalococcoidia bacterium]|nr:HIT domain-containing protein [Dehalococcoidia bacterium]